MYAKNNSKPLLRKGVSSFLDPLDGFFNSAIREREKRSNIEEFFFDFCEVFLFV